MSGRLEWFPKMFSAGDIDGSGLRKLLGASHHDPLALLVRETIQNSWDASLDDDGVKRPGMGTPSWTFELRTLSAMEQIRLRGAFSRQDAPGTRLREVLEAEVLSVIEISDRGTSGLGGPVRADEQIPPGVPTDFIDLVFNIGAPQDTDGGGGTYGFGKIAAFGVSACATVLYRTQPIAGVTEDAEGEHRLIGSTIGDNFDHDGKRYTGRHWWGAVHEGLPSPLVGDAAHALGDELFRHPFHGGQSGTSLLILQPDLGERDPEEAVRHVIDSVLWNSWPKLVPRVDGGEPPMHLKVRRDGQDVPIPDPADTQPFAGFVDALRNVRARSEEREPPPLGPHTLSLREHAFGTARPVRTVGHVAVAFTGGGVTAVETDVDEGLVPARHFEGPAHHLALLREPELVVRYLEGPALKQPRAQWCGVFKPVRDLDRCFAEAEPPSHDDWLIGRVTGRNEKIFVRRGREKGPAELFADLQPKQRLPSGDNPVHHLASIADALGHFVATGQAPSPKPRGPGRPKKPRSPAFTVGASVPMLMADGSAGLRIELTASRAVAVDVQASVALAGGGADTTDDLMDRLPEFMGVTEHPEHPPPEADLGHVQLQPGTSYAWIRNRGGAALSIDVSEVA